MNLKKLILDCLFSSEYRIKRIPFGIASGLSLNLCMRSEFHWYFGIYEIEIAAHFQRILRKTEVFLDVGSADGIYAACSLKGPQMKRVVAVDMDSVNIPRIQKNLDSNPNQVERSVICKKVSDRESQYEVTLESLIIDTHQKTLIKLDIEGGEAAVLFFSKDLLKNQNVSWIIEVHGEAVEKDCLKTIQETGRHYSIVPKSFFRRWIREGRSDNHNQWIVVE